VRPVLAVPARAVQCLSQDSYSSAAQCARLAAGAAR
jgi:hypothetical protein